MTSELVPLGKLAKIKTGKLDANASSSDGIYPFFTCAREPLRIATYSYDCECVLVAGNGDLNVKYYSGKFDAYQRTYIVEPVDSEKLHAKYLYRFMDSYLVHLRSKSIGGIIKYIKLGNLTEAPIPLPSISEQRRIAVILEKADVLRAMRREAIAKLDQLKQSVFLEMFGDPVTNSKEWPRMSFEELLDCIESGNSPVCLDRPIEGEEWGVLKLGAVTRCVFDPTANKALPPDAAYDDRLEVKKGDLLFTRKNTYELVAACAYVSETPPHLLLPDLIFRLRLKPSAPVLPLYLQALLTHVGKRKVIQSLAGGSAGSMPNISKAKLKTAMIELPPTALQSQYEQIVVSIEAIRSNQLASLAKLDATFESLQQIAFTGAL